MSTQVLHKNAKVLTIVTAFSAFLAGALSPSQPALADDTRNLNAPSASGSSGPTDATEDQAERVNVDTIKEKYWARGDQSELGVVQNRAYTKEHKWEVTLLGGTNATDPFLSVYTMGTTIGYHLSEYIAVQGIYLRDWASPSSALTTLQRQLTAQNSGSSQGASTNYNPPRDYYGGEVVGSLLYGKLSLLGQAIIYFDLNVIGGLGVTATESGNDFTQEIGFAEQIYISKHWSMNFAYRLQAHHETLTEHVITSEIGDSVGTRENFSNVFTAGISFMFGTDSKDSGKAAKGSGGSH